MGDEISSQTNGGLMISQCSAVPTAAERTQMRGAENCRPVGRADGLMGYTLVMQS